MRNKNLYQSFYILGIIFILLIVNTSCSKNQTNPTPISELTFPLSINWSFSFTENIIHLSRADDSTFLVRTRKYLYAMDAYSGEIFWSIALSKQGDPSPILVANKKVFIADSETLWALDQNTGQIAWEVKLQDKNIQVISATSKLILINQPSISIKAYDVVTASLLWTDLLGSRGPINAYIDGNEVFIPDEGLRTIDGTTGETIWVEEELSIGINDYSNGVMYYVDERMSNAIDTEIVAFDVIHRFELWRLKIPSFGFQRIKVEGNILFFMDPENLIVIEKLTGSLLWRTEIPSPVNPTIIDNNIYIMEGFNRIIRAFDSVTGNEQGLLKVAYPRMLLASNRDMIEVGGTLIFASGKYIFSYGK